MQAKEKLAEIAKKIDLEVKNALEGEYIFSHKISPIIDELLTNSQTIPVEGGKRIRGAFLYYSYLLCGGKNIEEILKTTAGIELIHAYLLIHDDIMDQSPLRRGFKTIHKIYEGIYKTRFNPIGSKHFGEAIGINVGDLYAHIGNSIFATSNFPDEYKIKALTKLDRSISDVVYGQVLDVFGEIEDVDEKYVIKVQHYKTGLYTYELPLHLGAILAGVNGDYMHALSQYAIPGGIAFQIQDDILGVFGDEKKTGKSAGSDITEGKRTLLTLKAYENANPAQKKILDNTLGNRKADAQLISDVRKVMIDTGSLDYSRNMAKRLLKKSTRGLLENKNNKWVQEGVDFLIGINDYLYTREI